MQKLLLLLAFGFVSLMGCRSTGSGGGGWRGGFSSAPPPAKVPEISVDERKIHEGDCKRGVARSCLEMAKLEEMAGKKTTARGYYKQACEMGDTESCDQLKTKKP